MRPKYKYQKKIDELMGKLKVLTPKQKRWALRLLPNYCQVKKKEIVCLECGRYFPNKGQDRRKIKCPRCRRKLTPLPGRKRTYKNVRATFRIIQVIEGHQVLRHYEIVKNGKAGEKSFHFIDELYQHWYTPTGKWQVASVLFSGMNFSCYGWSSYGGMELRGADNDRYYDWSAKIYPGYEVIPILRRNGFRKYPKMNHCLADLWKMLLTDPRMETLYKAKMYDVIKHIGKWNKDRLWPTLKICIRQNYPINDYSLWVDMIDALSYFDKDLRNPHYVCPENLKDAHDYWVWKKTQAIKKEVEKRNAERELERLKHEQKIQKILKDIKAKYGNIIIKEGKIEIRPLLTIEEYNQEGVIGHHCVNASYIKKSKILMTARTVDGEYLETIEYDMRKLKVKQCRGIGNEPSKHHNRILRMIEKHQTLFEKAVRRRTKKKENEKVHQQV